MGEANRFEGAQSFAGTIDRVPHQLGTRLSWILGIFIREGCIYQRKTHDLSMEDFSSSPWIMLGIHSLYT
jgi:hypothetical protein